MLDEFSAQVADLLLLPFRNYLIETLEHILLAIALYAALCILLYSFLFRRFFIRNVRLPDRLRRVLLVTAHPDDESMFFGPTIVALKRDPACRIFVLCLSNGNFDKLGRTRRQELFQACQVLGVPNEDVTLLNVTHLPDSPTVDWKIETVAQIVQRYVESLGIELLLTFDKDGVSHHPNHCAIFYAVASLCFSSLIPKSCKVLILESVNVCRKYISLFDLPLSLLMSTNWCVLNWTEKRLVQAAMREHKSQLLWFRKLYIIFSRYMLINSLREINLAEVEFEIIDS